MRLEQDLATAHVEVMALVELNSVSAVVACAARGVGIALLPRGTVRPSLASGALIELSWSKPLTARLYFIRHRDKPRTGAYGAFVTMVEQYFAKLPSTARDSRCPSETLTGSAPPARRSTRAARRP